MRENESRSKQDRTEVSVYNNQEPRVALKMKKRSKRSSSSSMEKLKEFAHPAIFATNASPSVAPSESEDDSSESEHDIDKSGVDTNQVNGRRWPLHVTSKRRKLSNDECISPSSSERSLSDRESIVFSDDKTCTANRYREEENNTSKLPQCSVTWSGFSTASAINQNQNSKRIIMERRGHLAQLKLNREKNRLYNLAIKMSSAPSVQCWGPTEPVARMATLQVRERVLMEEEKRVIMLSADILVVLVLVLATQRLDFQSLLQCLQAVRAGVV